MNDVTTPKTFEQKMKDRIKDSIGDLMTDEDLKKLITKGFNEAFFEPRPNPQYNNYHSGAYDRDLTLPPLIQEILTNLLKPTMIEAANNYIKDHSDEVMVIVEKVVAEGAGQAMMKAISANFSGQMLMLETNLRNQFANNR